jgi:hypothetical protein
MRAIFLSLVLALTTLGAAATPALADHHQDGKYAAPAWRGGTYWRGGSYYYWPRPYWYGYSYYGNPGHYGYSAPYYGYYFPRYNYWGGHHETEHHHHR